VKKPFLRVTKWLGNIPVEAQCTSCVDVKFQVRSTSHRPSREQYEKALQREFDRHCRTVHRPEGTSEGAAESSEHPTKA
jgi:hypothetical protein